MFILFDVELLHFLTLLMETLMNHQGYQRILELGVSEL